MKRTLYLYLLLIAATSYSQQRPVLDIMLTNYHYPYDVSYYNFKSQHQDIMMAYMDIRPQKANGKVIVLMHGKNFNGAYWKTTIDALTDVGYRVVVPDQIGFGKSSKPLGYQFSFQQLAQNTKELLDKLKIDIAFIREVTTNPQDAAIARTIIELAHSLNLQVIAEGVETSEQLAFLSDNGCDQVQGYLFCRPLPTHELETLLREPRCFTWGARFELRPPHPMQGAD